jgi:hypothetical protein
VPDGPNSPRKIRNTHRVIELHVWGRVLQGNLIRGYAFVGERGQTLWDEGEMTKEEQELRFKFFDERSAQAQTEQYWNREDLAYPDEDCVIRLASKWSLDPTMLDEQFREMGWGLLGQFSPPE